MAAHTIYSCTSNFKFKYEKTISFIFRSWMHVLFNFSSCSKDNDDNDTVYFTTEELIGVWEHSCEANGQWSELGEDNLIVFATSGSYIIHFQGNSYKGTYSVNGNTITEINTGSID